MSQDKRLRHLVSQDACAVAVALKQDGLNIFCVPVSFVGVRPESLPFHALGGRCHPGEDWPTAVIREVYEEVGERLQLISATSTVLVTSDGERHDIVLLDSPQPFCVYKRTTQTDPSFHHPDLVWLIGYLGDLRTADLQPRAEIAALLFLSDSMLKRCAHEPVRLRQIEDSGDGSRVVIRNGLQIDSEAVVVPEGLAIVLSEQL